MSNPGYRRFEPVRPTDRNHCDICLPVNGFHAAPMAVTVIYDARKGKHTGFCIDHFNETFRISDRQPQHGQDGG